MKAAIGAALALAGFVAAIWTPAGPATFAAFSVLAVGAGIAADAWLTANGEP